MCSVSVLTGSVDLCSVVFLHFLRSLMLWVPFSSPFTVASPFFGALCWFPEDEVAAVAPPDACCWASLSRNACWRVCTTSGMTASMSDSVSMGRPSKTVPSWSWWWWRSGRRHTVTQRVRQSLIIFSFFFFNPGVELVASALSPH